jgi:hypothetical protein
MRVLEFLPPDARRIVAEQAAVIIERASSFGEAHWGVTPHADGALRVNVGWTEILTAGPTQLRLIVDGQGARAVKLPDGVALHDGKANVAITQVFQAQFALSFRTGLLRYWGAP